jgi:hypothetical protein
LWVLHWHLRWVSFNTNFYLYHCWFGMSIWTHQLGTYVFKGSFNLYIGYKFEYLYFLWIHILEVGLNINLNVLLWSLVQAWMSYNLIPAGVRDMRLVSLMSEKPIWNLKIFNMFHVIRMTMPCLHDLVSCKKTKLPKP